MTSFDVPTDFYPAEEPHGLLLFVPALGTPAGFYRPFATELSARGIAALLPEIPGTGRSRPRPSGAFDYGYRDLVERYLPPLVEAARDRAGAAPLVLGGHSLGAQVACFAAGRRTVQVDALLTLAGGHIHYRNWRGLSAAGVWLAALLVDAMGALLGYVPAQYIGLGGPQARTLMKDWSRTIRSGELPYPESALQAAGRVPALSVAYEGDLLAPLRSVARLAALVDADVRSLPAESPGSPHAAWARHPEATVDLVVGWLRQRGVV